MALTREEIARRIALDLPDGCYVNLGVGIPTLVADYLPPEREIILHSENGILGMGPAPAEEERDPDLVDAGKEPVTLLPGAAIFHSADSFAMLRGGHIDIAVIGAFQVSEVGDLANWRLPGATLAGVGGAADIAVGARQVFVAMNHVTSEGQPKIVRECSYPLTARRVVKRIYTDLAVIEVTPEGLRLLEVAPGVTVAEVQAQTEPFIKEAGLPGSNLSSG
ncbi:MAG: 3-oxoacid CoA-transferase subunit B [Anaerolineae bacterium]